MKINLDMFHLGVVYQIVTKMCGSKIVTRDCVYVFIPLEHPNALLDAAWLALPEVE